MTLSKDGDRKKNQSSDITEGWRPPDSKRALRFPLAKPDAGEVELTATPVLRQLSPPAGLGQGGGPRSAGHRAGSRDTCGDSLPS